MNKRIKYNKSPIGAVKIIEDFLPAAGDLVMKEDVEKITISPSKRSVDFSRGEARKHGTQFDADAMAACYRSADQFTLDHSPAVLGLDDTGSEVSAS
jgi:hypothetical protein